MSAVTRSDDLTGEQPNQFVQQERRLPPDDPSDYAPRWLREASGQRQNQNVVAMRPPEAQKLAQQLSSSLRLRAPVNAAEPEPVDDVKLGFRPDPQWPREPAQPREPIDRLTPSFLRKPERASSFEGDRDIRRMWRQQSLAPSPMPEPPVREAPRGGLSVGVMLRFGGAIAAAAITAMVVVGLFATPKLGSRNTAAPPVETAVVADNVTPEAVAAPAEAESVAETAPSAEVETTAVAAAANEPAAIPAAPEPPVAVIAADELARMVKLGEDFVGQGDYAAARVILQRAAGAGDSRAALLLGGTFDPMLLRQSRVMGFKPDLATARVWYQKAAQSGSTEAARRLAALASLGD